MALPHFHMPNSHLNGSSNVYNSYYEFIFLNGEKEYVLEYVKKVYYDETLNRLTCDYILNDSDANALFMFNYFLHASKQINLSDP